MINPIIGGAAEAVLLVLGASVPTLVAVGIYLAATVL